MPKGGKRPGAGRPPAPNNRIPISIKIEPELWQHARLQPEGASAYIRRLIERDRQDASLMMMVQDLIQYVPLPGMPTIAECLQWIKVRLKNHELER